MIHGTAISVDIYGNMFVLDSESSTLACIQRTAHLCTKWGAGMEDHRFDRPAGIWARNGIDVYVADFGNHRIQRYDRTLTFVSSFSTRDNSNRDERFGYPSDVSLSRSGDLFICDTDNSRIIKVNRLNGVTVPFGGFGAGQGRLLHPLRAQVGPKDNVYVLDAPRVVVFDNFGNYLQDLSPASSLIPLPCLPMSRVLRCWIRRPCSSSTRTTDPGPLFSFSRSSLQIPFVSARSLRPMVFFTCCRSPGYIPFDPRK